MIFVLVIVKHLSLIAAESWVVDPGRKYQNLTLDVKKFALKIDFGEFLKFFHMVFFLTDPEQNLRIRNPMGGMQILVFSPAVRR